MAQLEDAAAKLTAALERLEKVAIPLAETRPQLAKNEALLAASLQEREGLLARVVELEEESRSLASITEDVEGRLDGAIAEIRNALGRN
jgi:chromosome segregation ATPase